MVHEFDILKIYIFNFFVIIFVDIWKCVFMILDQYATPKINFSEMIFI